MGIDDVNDECYWRERGFSVFYDNNHGGFYWVTREGQVGVERYNMVSTTVEAARRI